MTSEDVRSELERELFSPIRLHLVSGKTIEIRTSAAAWMLQNAIMIFPGPRADGTVADEYELESLRNIERLERIAA